MRPSCAWLLAISLTACGGATSGRAGAPKASTKTDPNGFDPTVAPDVVAADDTAVTLTPPDTTDTTAPADVQDAGPAPEDTAAPPPDVGPIAGCDPVPEYCDGKDNDCDGQIDDGVLGPCGDCNPRCGIAALGGPSAPLDATATTKQNVIPTSDGGLTLSLTTVALQVIWVSNSAEGTVSKLDTVSGRELGRYRVCVDPSRTGVSQYGDGWIACRSDSALVAYIWNNDGDCTDANGNGVIDTARDLDVDGKINPATEMMPLGQDECVRWAKPMSGSAELARAMGIDSNQHGWAGLWNAAQLVRIEPTSGNVVDTIQLNGNPYGLSIDDQGIIWVSSRSLGAIERVNPVTHDVKLFPCPASGCQPYGIALDEFGHVWIANLGGGPMTVERFDPNTETWAGVPVLNRPRGLVADKHGQMFVALDEASVVQVIDVAAVALTDAIQLGPNRFPLGMAVDANNRVWAVNQNASSVTKIDAASHAIIGEYPVGTGPYTYSDMTGSAFFNVVQPGIVTLRFQGKKHEGLSGLGALPGVTWTRLEVHATTPGTSRFQVRLRTAATEAALPAAPWSTAVAALAGPVATLDPTSILPLPHQRWLDVEVRLLPGGTDVPTLTSVDTQYLAAPAN